MHSKFVQIFRYEFLFLIGSKICLPKNSHTIRLLLSAQPLHSTFKLLSQFCRSVRFSPSRVSGVALTLRKICVLKFLSARDCRSFAFAVLTSSLAYRILSVRNFASWNLSLANFLLHYTIYSKLLHSVQFARLHVLRTINFASWKFANQNLHSTFKKLSLFCRFIGF